MVTLRGSAAIRSPAQSTTSTPRGKRARFAAQAATETRGHALHGEAMLVLDARTGQAPAAAASSVATCNTSVAPCCGFSSLPATSESSEGGAPVASTKDASGAATKGAPQWKRSQPRHLRLHRTRAACRHRERQQHGGRAGISGAGARRALPACTTRPGRLIASSTARKAARASSTGIGEAGRERDHRIVAMVKNSTRVAAARRASASRAACWRAASGRSRRASSHRAAWVLQRGVGQRGELRLALVATRYVGVADEVAESDGATGHGHLAQVEGAPSPPARPRTITRPFRRRVAIHGQEARAAALRCHRRWRGEDGHPCATIIMG